MVALFLKTFYIVNPVYKATQGNLKMWPL